MSIFKYTQEFTIFIFNFNQLTNLYIFNKSILNQYLLQFKYYFKSNIQMLHNIFYFSYLTLIDFLYKKLIKYMFVIYYYLP